MAPADADEWIKARSANFELYTTNGEKRAREAVLFFEQVHDLFLRVRSGKPTLEPVRIIAFRNEKEYKPYRPGEFAAAYYLASELRDTILMSALGSESFPVAVHEYTHLWLKHSGLKLPPWLNEGLADIHSTLRQQGKQVVIGHPMTGRLYTLNRHKWIALPRLLAVEQDSPEYNERDRAGIFYAQSWLLTHMLYLSDAYRPNFGRFVSLLQDGIPAEKALQTAYGKELQQVQKELETYARSTSLNSVWFNARLVKPSEQPVISPAGPLESGMVLAELLGLLGNRAESTVSYQELLRQNPDRWEIEEALARLRFRSGDNNGAKEHFSRAVALKATNARLYLDYARLLTGEDDVRAVMLLKRALELTPGLRDARLLLGLKLFNLRRFNEAVSELSQLREVSKEEAPSFFLSLAYSYFELGRREEAIRAAEKAKQFAVKPYDADAAHRLAAFLNEAGHRSSPAPAIEVERAAATRPAGPAAATGPHAPVRPAEPAVEPSGGNLRVVHKRPIEKTEGVFERLDCLGQKAVLVIERDGRRTRLLVDDPGQVSIKGDHATLNLACGPQKPRPVVIEYLPQPDSGTGAMGIVRTLIFVKE
ncbi:MAG: tetratricopeptide repeat protein [Acidobacteria bacterium]|nr:tetratricopeptide repeat protein [Acidobacteriota bacterium]